MDKKLTSQIEISDDDLYLAVKSFLSDVDLGELNKIIQPIVRRGLVHVFKSMGMRVEQQEPTSNEPFSRKFEIDYCCPVSGCEYRGTEGKVYAHMRTEHNTIHTNERQ